MSGVCDDPRASSAKSALIGVADKIIVGCGKTDRVGRRTAGTFFFQNYTISLLFVRSTCTKRHWKENHPKFFPVSFNFF